VKERDDAGDAFRVYKKDGGWYWHCLYSRCGCGMTKGPFKRLREAARSGQEHVGGGEFECERRWIS